MIFRGLTIPSLLSSIGWARKGEGKRANGWKNEFLE
jgi:hypothetical protein